MASSVTLCQDGPVRNAADWLFRLTSILMIVVVLYFLSVGPVAAWAWNYNRYPPALSLYLEPVCWLDKNTFLEGPIEAYAQLWVKLWPKD